MYRTLCCKALEVRAGRADYRCSKCGKEVTIEMSFYYQAVDDLAMYGKRKEKIVGALEEVKHDIAKAVVND